MCVGRSTSWKCLTLTQEERHPVPSSVFKRWWKYTSIQICSASCYVPCYQCCTTYKVGHWCVGTLGGGDLRTLKWGGLWGGGTLWTPIWGWLRPHCSEGDFEDSKARGILLWGILWGHWCEGVLLMWNGMGLLMWKGVLMWKGGSDLKVCQLAYNAETGERLCDTATQCGHC